MGEQPIRVQLRRTKGWRMPPNTVKVDRSGKGFWGNPFPTSLFGQAQCVSMFRERLASDSHSYWTLRRNRLPDLAGKNLACWCKPGQPCHADVLLELANRPECRLSPPEGERDG